jgi:hypothetical protein
VNEDVGKKIASFSQNQEEVLVVGCKIHEFFSIFFPWLQSPAQALASSSKSG